MARRTLGEGTAPNAVDYVDNGLHENHKYPRCAPRCLSRLVAQTPPSSFSSFLQHCYPRSFRMLLFLQCLTLFTGSLALSLPSAEHLRHLQSKADSGLMPRSSCENTATSRDCWGEYSIDTNYYVSLTHVAPNSLKRIITTLLSFPPCPLLNRDGHPRIFSGGILRPSS